MDIKLHKFLITHNCNTIEDYIVNIRRNVVEMFFTLSPIILNYNELLNRLNGYLAYCREVDDLKKAGFSVYTKVIDPQNIVIKIN